MAASLLPFRPVGVHASAGGGQRQTETRRRGSSPSNWWTPLFSWSSEPDYIEPNRRSKSSQSTEEAEHRPHGSDREPKPVRSRFSPGCFTEEKAKRLRLMTMEASSFHDAMYHSAIASRLASDFSNLSDR